LNLSNYESLLISWINKLIWFERDSIFVFSNPMNVKKNNRITLVVV